MYLALAVLGAIAPAIVARRRGRRSPVIVLVFTMEAVGLLVLGFGLLALMFDGYVEDYGSEPADTLDKAILGLVIGVVCSAAAWYIALRRRKDRRSRSKSPNTRTSSSTTP